MAGRKDFMNPQDLAGAIKRKGYCFEEAAYLSGVASKTLYAWQRGAGAQISTMRRVSDWLKRAEKK